MGSVNKAILVGNLGRDPEVRYTSGGQPVANFSVATNERWTDKNTGQLQERTEWHRVVVWGKQAESCGEYLAKGRQVYVEGRIQTREWTDKEGKKNYSTEVVANQVVFLGGRGDGAGRRSGPPADDFGPMPPNTDDAPAGASPPALTDVGVSGAPPATAKGAEDDIPF